MIFKYITSAHNAMLIIQVEHLIMQSNIPYFGKVYKMAFDGRARYESNKH